MIIYLMGVTGSGKTTTGKLLAARLGAEFIDADDLHPPQNIAKMAEGTPLSDADRQPWLHAVRVVATERARLGANVVVACSALRESYRQILASAGKTMFVYLRADRSLARERLAARQGHFMPASLIDSQFETLEEPALNDALAIDAAQPPETIVEQIIERLT